MTKKNVSKHEMFIVDFNALLYLDNFLISSITSIIFIRVFLALSGYPQLGGDSLHIAHMLWGGLLMMITLICLLAFINKNAKIIGSVIGGIGFGIFVDELGKFITHDNNYFFQPTFALLYVIFLLIYFSFRTIFHIIEKDDKEFVMNALEILKEAVFFDLDTNEKQKLKMYLTKADQNHPLVKEMEVLLQKLEAKPVDTKTSFIRLKKYLRQAYINTVQSRHFVIVLFALLFTGSLTNVLLVINNLIRFISPNFWNVGLFISVTVSTVFTLWGLVQLSKKNTLLAYLYLRRATMVSILFVQFFAFYYHQLTALVPLLTAFITYVSIQSLLEEKHNYTFRTKK